MAIYLTCMTCHLHRCMVDGALLYATGLASWVQEHVGHDVRLLPSDVARALSGPQDGSSAAVQG